MEQENIKGAIEAILFGAGREVTVKELCLALEKSKEEIEDIVNLMNTEYLNERRGIEIVKANDAFQLATKKEFYDYIYKVIDKRSEPKLSNAALETLSIIAYNPKITRPEIEAIRGVNSDGTMYKLLEYGLIEEARQIRPSSENL